MIPKVREKTLGFLGRKEEQNMSRKYEKWFTEAQSSFAEAS